MNNNSAFWSTVISSDSYFRRQPRRKRAIGFLPGAFFLLLGLLVAYVPQLVIGAIATLFVVVGLLLCYAAWKIAQFKRTLRNLASDVESRVHTEGVKLRHPDIELEQGEYKKVVFH
jgi:protein-S-isoprenylcysteine O-methyltransferase Ste14